MKNALLLLVAGVSVFAIACSKDDDNDPTPAQVTMITNNIWKIDSMGYDTNNDGKIDNNITLTSCMADNTLSFNADSTGVFGEGAIKCDPSDPTSTPITWHFKNNYQTIAMDGLVTALDGDVSVKALTDSTLVLSVPITSPVTGALIVKLED